MVERAEAHLKHGMRVQAQTIYSESKHTLTQKPEPQLDFTLTLIDQVWEQRYINDPVPIAQDTRRVIGKE
ncbi:hypothetical protein RRG08_042493 [Elysia crispata]|uniref:Uncharacterized protein n=1 Tax=Elysia crispata TaxID=231223 RepID=A0AAE1CX35_9GAST|nr:hypothetical protein RRG08_042493 [Elysia crispata]